MHRETSQREAILTLLRGVSSHPTADAIYERVREVIPNISKGTVYRNLKVLREMGLISELNLNGTVTRYEAKQDIHYHIRCEQCGVVSDIDMPVNMELNHQAASTTGHQISHHQLEFRGICRDCLRK